MFDRYVAAQENTAGRTRRQVLIVVSIAAHFAMGVGLIVWSFVHVEEVAPPPLTVTFFKASAPPPPPPPPPPAGTKKKTTPKTPVTQPKQVQPLIQPKQPEPPDEKEGEEGGKEGGKPGGVAGGVEGGVEGGVVGSPTPPPPPPPPAPVVKPKNVPHAPELSEWINHPDPHVPEAIKIQRKGSGDAVFVAVMCIDTSGVVTDVKIKVGLPGADDAIERVLRTWLCKPQPIPICFPIRLTFTFE